MPDITDQMISDSPRRAQLREWLDRIHAAPINTIEGGPNRSELRFYACGPVTFIIQVWEQRPHGEISWELYAPVSLSGETQRTFDALEALVARTMKGDMS